MMMVVVKPEKVALNFNRVSLEVIKSRLMMLSFSWHNHLISEKRETACSSNFKRSKKEMRDFDCKVFLLCSSLFPLDGREREKEREWSWRKSTQCVYSSKSLTASFSCFQILSHSCLPLLYSFLFHYQSKFFIRRKKKRRGETTSQIFSPVYLVLPKSSNVSFVFLVSFLSLSEFLPLEFRHYFSVSLLISISRLETELFYPTCRDPLNFRLSLICK